MQTDKFLFTDPEKALDKIERLAGCYAFSTKDILQIRLLAEEIISVIAPTLKLSSGRCWVTTTEKAFAVTIDCSGGLNALDAQTREALLKMSRSDQRGLAGVLGKVMAFLSIPDVNMDGLSSEHMICYYGMEMGHSGYHWNPAFFNAVSIPEPKLEPAENHDLAMSIIEGFADDIRVGLKRGKNDIRLQMTVAKNFTTEQTSEIEF